MSFNRDGLPDLMLIPIDENGNLIPRHSKFVKYVNGAYATLEMKLIGDKYGKAMLWKHRTTKTHASFIQMLNDDAIRLKVHCDAIVEKVKTRSTTENKSAEQLALEMFPDSQKHVKRMKLNEDFESGAEMVQSFNNNYSAGRIVLTKTTPNVKMDDIRNVGLELMGVVKKNDKELENEINMAMDYFLKPKTAK